MTNKNKRLNFDSVLKMVQEEPEHVFERHARMLSDLTREKAAKRLRTAYCRDVGSFSRSVRIRRNSRRQPLCFAQFSSWYRSAGLRKPVWVTQPLRSARPRRSSARFKSS